MPGHEVTSDAWPVRRTGLTRKTLDQLRTKAPGALEIRIPTATIDGIVGHERRTAEVRRRLVAAGLKTSLRYVCRDRTTNEYIYGAMPNKTTRN